ncbi:hypothetical protein EV182_002654, partial [Spiromyces aspiralis]
SVLQVALVAFSGFIFARLGTLDPTVIKKVSKLIIGLLTPCFLFSKMVKTLEIEIIGELWINPCMVLLYGAIGLAWTQGSARLLRLPRGYTRLLDVTVFSPNTNTIPYALIASIATNPDAAFSLRDEDDTLDKVAARGLAYAVTYGILSNLIRWSVAIRWICGGSADRGRVRGGRLSQDDDRGEKACGHGMSGYEDSADGSKLALPRSATEDSCTSLNPKPMWSAYSGSSTSSTSRSGGTGDLRPAALREQPQQHKSTRLSEQLSGTTGQIATKIWRGYISAMLTPPMIGIYAALVVLGIAPLHQNMLTSGTLLNTVFSSVSSLSDACIPMTLLSFGAQLGTMRQPSKSAEGPTAGHNEDSDGTASCIRRPQPSVKFIRHAGVAIVMTGRFLVVPVIGGIILILIRLKLPSLVPLLVRDSILLVVILLLSASPTATNLISISQAYNVFIDEMAIILLWSYLLGAVFMTIEISFALQLVSRINSWAG